MGAAAADGEAGGETKRVSLSNIQAISLAVRMKAWPRAVMR